MSNEDRAAQDRHDDDAHVGDRLDQPVNAPCSGLAGSLHVRPRGVTIPHLSHVQAQDVRRRAEGTRGVVPEWYQSGT